MKYGYNNLISIDLGYREGTWLHESAVFCKQHVFIILKKNF